MATSDGYAAHRAVMKYCVDRVMTPTQTKQEMDKTVNFRTVSRTLTFKWHRRFKDGWTNDLKMGRPKIDKNLNINKVKSVIDGDRRQTVREVAEKVDISKSAVHRILCEDLHMRRVSARWVPRLLSTEEMSKRVTASRHFLSQYNRDPSFLDKIITMDETWVHYYEPESKRQSSVWKTAGTPPPKKARSVKSMDKVMYMMFMDKRGIIFSHEVPQGKTVNAAYYSKVVRRDLLHAIRKKRKDMADDMENINYHHDNVQAHTAVETDLELAILGFQRIPHPPYSPDLAPLDYAYFPLLKDYIRGTTFTSEDEIRKAVLYFNTSLDYSDEILRAREE